VTDEKIASLGLWIEQLTLRAPERKAKAYSGGGRTAWRPAVYGPDRVFVTVSTGTSGQGMKSKLDALTAAGHPAAYRQLTDLYDLGAEFSLGVLRPHAPAGAWVSILLISKRAGIKRCDKGTIEHVRKPGELARADSASGRE